MSTQQGGSAGGAAMNAGAGFGQRLGAFFAVAMLREFDVASFIDVPQPLVIQRVSFETDHPTDDLLLTGSTMQVFVQVKRSLSLSAEEKSEFRSVIRQFVGQWIAAGNKPHVLLLALGPRASQKLSQDLRKILTGLRVGDHGSDPLSRSERETLDVFTSVVTTVYQDLAGGDLPAASFAAFVDRVRIVTFDIDDGGSDERTAIVLCSTISALTIAPQLLWAEILRIAASSSSARHSIGKEALSTLVTSWVAAAPASERQGFFDVIVARDIPCGREVIAFRSDDLADGRIMVMDLRRFQPDGTRRVRFVNETCILKNGINGKLIARAGTQGGLFTILKERIAASDEVIAFPGPDGDPDAEPAARAHGELLRRAQRHDDLLRCVQCNDAVAQPEATLVEVDEEGVTPAFGPVHANCIRPSHRRTGIIKVPFFAEHSRLVGFDLERWARALHRGQGIFSANPFTGRVALAWTPPTPAIPRLPYCVRLEYETGIIQYATKRMHVERFSEAEAADAAAFARTFIGGANPAMLATESLTFGSRSHLARARPLEQLVLLQDATPVKISASILEAYSTCDNYYAPLMIVLVGREHELLAINGRVAFLTDPLQFDRFYENWRRGGLALDDYRVDILASDHEFDELISSVFEQGMPGIVNPLIDLDGHLVEGVPIGPLPLP